MSMYQRAQLVLNAAKAALDAGPTSSPDRWMIVAGEPAWDSCCPGAGQLTVNLRELYGSDNFPIDAAQTSEAGCCPAWTVADMSVLLTRCAPSPDDQGNPPTPRQLDANAQIVMDDCETLFTAVAQQLAVQYADMTSPTQVDHYVVARAQVVGPQGGCVGIQVDYMIGVSNG